MGNNTNNSININGRRYDALTGKPLDMGGAPAVPAKSPRSIDGFAAPGKTHAAPRKRAPHAPASHLAPHKPQRAATLMRNVVKKPDLRSSKLVAKSPASVAAAVPTHAVVPKLSHASVNPKRLKRAKQVIQSPVVSRYGSISAVDSLAASITPYTPVTPAAPKPASQLQSGRPVDITAKQRPIHHVTKQPDIFEQALTRATSHEQPPVEHKNTRKRGRLMGAATAGLAVLLILGAFAYFNAPQLSLMLASSRAGFEARLPNYSPAGFSFGDLSYSPGNVVLSYKAGDETKRFDITQRVSNWDSEGLLSNFVSSAASAYQTYNRAGRTVYFYDDNSATWVDSGVWYIIDGSNSLTKNQVLDMAGSL